MLLRILSELVHDSPSKNALKIARRFGLAAPEPPRPSDFATLLHSEVGRVLFRHAVEGLGATAILIAGDITVWPGGEELESKGGLEVRFQSLTWVELPRALSPAPGEYVVLALEPQTAGHWAAVRQLRLSLGSRFSLRSELLRPYTQFTHARAKLDYFAKSGANLIATYLGRKINLGVAVLEKAFPLSGKSVIEFGPLDAEQTAGLVTLGAKRIVCVDARPENCIKLRLAADLFGWRQVETIPDDFHNVDAVRHGRFDVCFAHGVYYHSMAPFVFLENLRTLSDTIYLGGFCATDRLPATPYSALEYEGGKYRAKEYQESNVATGGLDPTGYFFQQSDLIRFFTERGHHVQILQEETMTVYAGNYTRMLITRAASPG